MGSVAIETVRAAASRRAPALVTGGGCIALAALSLALPSVPTTDPWGWIVWGRELVGLDLHTSVGGSPSWKPLPVLVTAPLSLFGDAAPDLWLVIARAGGLLGLVMAYLLAARLGGRLAGVTAAVCLVATTGWLRSMSHGYTEPAIATLVLAAAERHVAGSRRWALALLFLASLARPEAFVFVLCYGAYLLRSQGDSRRYVLALLGAAPLLWLGGDLLGSGDPLRGGRAAKTASDLNGLDVLASFGPRVGWPTLVVALLTLVFIGRRDRTLAMLGGSAAAWVATVSVLAAVGGPSASRFLTVPAAIVCVLAGVGIGKAAAAVAISVGRTGVRPAVAAVAIAACVIAPVADRRTDRMETQLRAADRRAEIQGSLERVAQRLRSSRPHRCGPVTLPESLSWNRGAMAWTLDRSIDKIHTEPPAPPREAVVFTRPSRTGRVIALRLPSSDGAVYVVPIREARVRVDSAVFGVQRIDYEKGWTVAEVCPRRPSYWELAGLGR